MTIAQIVYDNERFFGYSDEDIHNKVRLTRYGQITQITQSQLMRIWAVMDECIRTGVHAHETTLPGRLGLRRRAPMLYRRLMRG
jgi:L-serine deaminase